MTDTTTKQPLYVRNEGTAGPYIILPFTQLEETQRLLDSHDVFYWVGENAISIDGAPETVFINFGREGEPALVQSVLDSAP